MNEAGMEYLFVFSDGGWWLKLTTAEQIVDYHRKHENRYEGALQLYMKWKQTGRRYEDIPIQERIALQTSKDFKYLQCALMQARAINGTIFDGFRCMNMEAGKKELRDIQKHGAVYINQEGGSTYGLEYTQFCRKKELVFPDFTKKDIRVKRFNGGNHWYAYIGEMQVRNGDQLKWNTYEDARAAAEAVLE